jgi:hypothetical protein
MPISELNYNLLQLLRDYKNALIYRETFRILLSQYQPELPQPMIQNALSAVRIPLDRKFLQAEQELQDGKDTLKVLDEFLHSST